MLCKYKKLAHVLSLGTLIERGKCLNINHVSKSTNNYDTNDTMSFYMQVIILIAVTLTIIWILLKYYKFLVKISKYITLPCPNVLTMGNKPKLNVALYIGSINEYIILNIANINFMPTHLLKIITTGAVEIELKEMFFLSSHIIFKNSDIFLESTQKKKNKV